MTASQPDNTAPSQGSALAEHGPVSESAVSESPIFSDGKAPDALRTIGEVTRALGIRQHVLRYWEEQFTALRPIKRSGNRRYYRPEDVALIARIDRLVHREGYTIKGAAKALSEKPAPPPATAAPEALPAVVQPVAENFGGPDFAATLRRIRDNLAKALAAA